MKKTCLKCTTKFIYIFDEKLDLRVSKDPKPFQKLGSCSSSILKIKNKK
jgi:hypothetical protein